MPRCVGAERGKAGFRHPIAHCALYIRARARARSRSHYYVLLDTRVPVTNNCARARYLPTYPTCHGKHREQRDVRDFNTHHPQRGERDLF